MPQIGFGSWGVRPREVPLALRTAVASGYRLFDLAPVYNNEAAVGDTLAALQAEGAVTRSDLFLTSKVAPADACDSERLRAAVRRTLHDLRTEYLDLYLVHWPFYVRPGAPSWPPPLDYQLGYSAAQLRETWCEMERLVAEGRVRAIGLANIGPNRLAALLRAPDLRVRPAAVQVELHPYNSQASLRALCASNQIVVTAYASLGSAARPAKYQSAADGHPTLLSDPAVLSVARALGGTPAAVALGWALRRGVAVIPKSSRASRVRSNLEETLRLAPRMGPEALASLDALERGHRYLAAGFQGYAWRRAMTMEQLWDDEPVPGFNRPFAWLVLGAVAACGCGALRLGTKCVRARRDADRVARRLSFGVALEHISSPMSRRPMSSL